MGKCTVSSALLEGFSCARAENQDQVRCKLDNRVFRISHGRFDLKQQEETQLHKKAVTARAATPDIRTATSSQTDCQQLRGLIIHVLDIVVNGQSFASSDSASSARGKYKQMFPDSGHANIKCGKTKATYMAVQGIAPYARTILKNEFKDKFVGIYLDERSYDGKTRVELWVVYYADGVRKNRYLRTMELNFNVDTDPFVSTNTKSLSDFKLVSSQNIFDATIAALGFFDIPPHKCQC